MHAKFLYQLKAAHRKGRFLAFIKDSAASSLLFKEIPHLLGLDQVPQNPRWHPEGDVWIHTLLVIENLPSNASFAMSLAALLHDIGKKTKTVILETGAISAKGHEADSEKMAHEILLGLGADENLIKEVIFLVRHHMTAHNQDANAKTLRRLIREGGRELVDQLLQHGVADVSGGCRDFKDCERMRNLFDNLEEDLAKPNSILTGDEIIELGFTPGPEVGCVLRALSDLGEIDRETAIEFVKKLRKTLT